MYRFIERDSDGNLKITSEQNLPPQNKFQLDDLRLFRFELNNHTNEWNLKHVKSDERISIHNYRMVLKKSAEKAAAATIIAT